MAYFLAGVANATVIDTSAGDTTVFTAKTLIDSSITVGVSAEDIRAGIGAKLYGKYFHTTTFDLKMTDAMFKMEYLAANVGADIECGGDVYKTEALKASATKEITLSSAPRPFIGTQNIFLYYKPSTQEDYRVVQIVEANFDDATNVVTLTDSDITENTEVCVKYFYNDESARSLKVNSTFIPKTLAVVLEANLYSGDVADVGSGTKAGTLVIKVPRYLLNGNQEIGMSMTGAANTPFEGSALATKGEGCDGDGIYAEIIEVIDNRELSDIEAIAVENASQYNEILIGKTYSMRVFGKYPGMSPMLLPSNSLKAVATGANSSSITITNMSFTAATSDAIPAANITVTAGLANDYNDNAWASGAKTSAFAINAIAQ